MSKENEPLKKIQEGLADTSKQIQEGLTGTARDIWLAGLGVLSTVEEEGQKVYKTFIEKGKELISKGEEFQKRDKESGITAKVSETVRTIEDKLHSAIEPFGVATNQEVKELNEKVDKLTESIAELVKKLDADGKSASRNKTTA